MADIDPAPRSPTFSLHVVCTANQCRSPLAEHLLRARCAALGLDWVVTSSGTQAVSGAPMHEYVQRILLSRGIDVGAWVSSTLEPESVASADLILTATEAHRGVVAQLVPSAMSRTFTLLQFAHLTHESPGVTSGGSASGGAATGGAGPAGAEFGRSLLTHAATMRGRVQPLLPSERDLADPIGQSFRHFRRCAESIDAALDQILDDVGATSPSESAPGSPAQGADPAPIAEPGAAPRVAPRRRQLRWPGQRPQPDPEPQ